MSSLRVAVRALRRTPGFTLIAVLTMALAIGSSTAVFSVVNAVVLHGLPYPHSDRLRAVYERNEDGSERVPSFPTFSDWQAAARGVDDVIDALAFVRGDGLLIGASPQRQIGAFVTPGFFDLMKTRPLFGRVFVPEEERPGAPPVAVLSYDFFMHRFGGDRAIVGRLVQFDSVPTTVVGVMPRGFAYPNFGGGGWLPPAAWQPIALYQAMHPAPLSKRELHVDSRAILRLRPGVDSAKAAAAMRTIAQRLALEYPHEQGHWTSVALRGLSVELFGRLWSTLALIAGAIGLVLLLACANVANLLLIRGSVRAQDFAVRAALGAGPWRIARLPLEEAMLISLGGGVLGVLLAYGLVSFARPFAAQRLPFADHIALDPAAVLAAVAITALAALLVGTIPALQMSRMNVVDRLRGGAASRGGAADFRVRNALVSLQFALAVALLVGAGLLVQSVRRLADVPLGYQPDGLLSFAIAPPAHRYDSPAQAAALYSRILEAVRAVPTVQSAAAAGGALLSTKVVLESHATAENPPIALYHPISSDFLRTLHVGTTQGRGFTDEDMRSPVGLLVSDTLARKLWPRGDAVGQRITIYRQSQARADIGQPITLPIIGVVADYHEFGADADVPEQVFLPYTLEVWPWMNFVVRGAETPSLLAAVRRAVQSVEPAVTFRSEPAFDHAGGPPSLSDPRMFVTSLLSGFAATALLLAAIGLYGVVAYAVTQRTREIGIRLSIGATPGRIVLLLVRQASLYVAIGMIAGLAAAFAGTRVLRALLFQTTPSDPTTFLVVPIVLGLVALAASAVPASRAARTDPAIVIRAE
ncbi:MAG TPA: ABC transporter permease [Gemmatimonadaceae bacterium]|nr:ABC transporter permease [Gemmatimonadaceae bacterium]